MHIDHLDKSDEEEIMAKRSEAKAKIRQASDMLANSDGVLDGEVRDIQAIMRFLQCFYLGMFTHTLFVYSIQSAVEFALPVNQCAFPRERGSSSIAHCSPT